MEFKRDVINIANNYNQDISGVKQSIPFSTFQIIVQDGLKFGLSMQKNNSSYSKQTEFCKIVFVMTF